MATGWRIIKSRRARSAFDGEGARLYGGRWNSPWTRVVYVAGSVSLAVLEVLVHLGDVGVLSSYSLCAVEFENVLIESLDRSTLPADWRSYPAPSGLRGIGDAWVRDGISAVLEVPSAVVERESNYLINPEHPNFDFLKIGEPELFEFDPRLL